MSQLKRKIAIPVKLQNQLLSRKFSAIAGGENAIGISIAGGRSRLTRMYLTYMSCFIGTVDY